LLLDLRTRLATQIEQTHRLIGNAVPGVDLIGDDVLRIETLGVDVPLGEIYDGIVPEAAEGA